MVSRTKKCSFYFYLFLKIQFRLRLAEACIMVHKQTLKEQTKKNLVSSVIGSGMHRKYVLQPSPHKYISDDEQSFAIPSPNLEFASLCLRNALTLVDFFSKQIAAAKAKADAPKPVVPEKKLNAIDLLLGPEEPIVYFKFDVLMEIDDGVPCNPSKPLNNESFEKLKCGVLTAYSYVLICLGEYVLALKYGKELLKVPNIPDTHKMLGHLYCAESLIMMDRLSDAVYYLEPKFIKQLQGDDFETRGSPDWNVNSSEAAQAVMTYNLAVTLLIQGDFELARSALKACNHPIVHTNLKIIEMYMELHAGNLENCKNMVRMDTPQYL